MAPTERPQASAATISQRPNANFRIVIIEARLAAPVQSGAVRSGNL
jgi:hypothetical protein